MLLVQILASTTERGVVERRFDLSVGTDVVPGIQWLPEDTAAPCPTVLIGHGGTQHNESRTCSRSRGARAPLGFRRCRAPRLNTATVSRMSKRQNNA